MYDEAADLKMHSAEVAGLRAALTALGLKDAGFENCLDIGGGYGLHAPWLCEMAKTVTIADMLDYAGAFDGMAGKLLGEKFARHGIMLETARVNYHTVDARHLIYRDGLFDLVISVNAFEHILDPETALHEAIRVARPGATVVLQFDPLWRSAEGHHLPHLGFAPWQHLVEGDEAFRQSIRARGGSEREVEVFNSSMNRVPYADFVAMLTGPNTAYFSQFHFSRWAAAETDEPQASHPNFAALRARGISADDLIVRGIRFVGVRNSTKVAPPARKASRLSRLWGHGKRDH